MRRIFMNLYLLVAILITAVCCEAQKIEDTRLTMELKNGSLKEAIKIIEELTPFRFLAKAEDIEGQMNITISVQNQPLDKILNQLLEGRNLYFQQIDRNILIKKTNQQPQGATITQASQTSGQSYSLYGTIKAQRSGETIIGANIVVVSSPRGTSSNEYGFYSISLPKGDYTVQVSAVSMQTQQVQVSLQGNTRLDIALEDDIKDLDPVIVTSGTGARNIASPQMSMERLNVKEVNKIPVIFGERDILKTIQLLPGVKAAGEGNSGFYVRGGAADQNLILLDEAPVYNATHLLGFFSTFNSDAIKNVTLYKGGMPSQYGGRLSSVVDIKMNDGNNQDFGMSGGIGLIASRLNIEGPIQKNKSSFLVSGRRTYADMFLKLFGDSSLKQTKLYFYDVNAKASFILGRKDRIFVSGYFGRDMLRQEELAGIDWGNATATLRWNHIFNTRLFSNTSFIFSNYDYNINISNESTDYRIRSHIKDWNLKQEFQWYVNADNTITMGLNAIYHTIKPGEISVTGNTGSVDQGLPDRYSLDNAVYASNTWKLNDKWNMAYGFRVSIFSILGEGDYYTLNSEGKVIDTTHYDQGDVVKTYVNVEPRIAVSLLLNSTSSLKLSYTRNTQNLHLISNSTSSSPTDKWVASTNIIKPEIADQVAIGYYKNMGNSLYELNIEAYYKAMQNQIDYRNGAQVFSNQAIETQLLYGIGRAYGLEWQLKKKAGRLNGWISYTLSKTERKIDGINNNLWYNARQDRTHDIAIVGIFQLNKKWTLSANWIYYTGDAVTYPAGKYTLDNEVYFQYSERNGYRMPAYHRLDLGATVQLKKT
ncbi:MAG TPA: TonB-dependent receptor, partial [Chitinophagaceae bacterium]|nr:TonB-dependent receptor [Chitinophagaceae bacterium]